MLKAPECDRCGDEIISDSEVSTGVRMCFDCYDYSGQGTDDEFMLDLPTWKRPPADPISVRAACVALVEERARLLFGDND